VPLSVVIQLAERRPGWDAAALALATNTDDDQLGAMMESAPFAGHTQLAHAVATVSAQRGRGDLLSRFFDEAEEGAEARSLYAEWTEVNELLGEGIERQRANVEQVVQAQTTTGWRPLQEPGRTRRREGLPWGYFRKRLRRGFHEVVSEKRASMRSFPKKGLLWGRFRG
jgi:hypothetical protein